MSVRKLAGLSLALAMVLTPLTANACHRRGLYHGCYHPGYRHHRVRCCRRHHRPRGLFGCGNPCCCLPPVSCHPCFMAAPSCGCGQPFAAPIAQPVFSTQLQPVIETAMRPQQVVTYKDVPQTVYQRQAYVENVPMTTYRTVTVDQGSYQMVWVPKLVQKQIPQTVYVPQTRYRDVAVQVNRRIAQVQTQMVPQQVVRYVPRSQQVAMPSIVGWQAIPPQYGVIASPQSVPTAAGMPQFTLPGEPTDTASRIPTPDPQFIQTTPSQNVDNEWSTIRQRSALPGDGRTSFNHSRREGVPSAATVWQARLGLAAVAR